MLCLDNTLYLLAHRYCPSITHHRGAGSAGWDGGAGCRGFSIASGHQQRFFWAAVSLGLVRRGAFLAHFSHGYTNDDCAVHCSLPQTNGTRLYII